MSRVAILVTGSREWTDLETIEKALKPACREASPGESVLIHGDCEGADRLAALYAQAQWGIPTLAMPAPWNKTGNERYDRRAGPRRNAEMVRVLVALRFCGYDCRVFAFPMDSSIGTWNCTAEARRSGFKPKIVHPR